MFTLTDLEIALGRVFTADEEPNVQYLIDATTSYIQSITDLSFSVVEDETVRYMADYYGLVELSPGPVNDVSAVTPISYGAAEWFWDGLYCLYNLYPNQVVDVTYSYGTETVPTDLKFVAIEMTKYVVDNLPQGALKTKQVGDVQYSFSEAANNDFNGLGSDVLDSYREGAFTMRVGRRAFPNSLGTWP